jgi:hypothetical protein
MTCLHDKITDYAARTRQYMATANGRNAWYVNRREYGYTDQANRAAAVMTACRLVRYETISAVVQRMEGHR